MTDDQNDKEHIEFKNQLESLHSAIYGDGNGNIGMKKMLEEMYNVFVPITLTGKFIIKLIGLIGGLAVAAGAVYSLFRSSKG